jgi:hypothetical protein
MADDIFMLLILTTGWLFLLFVAGVLAEILTYFTEVEDD